MGQIDITKAVEQSLGLSSGEIYLKGYELVKNLNNHGSILDFGSGQGRFLTMLSDLQFEKISGADLMIKPENIPSLHEWIQSDLNSGLPLVDESFDVIAAIEIIEHLENPRAVVREMVRLLKPGGYLVLSTPNNESIRSIMSLVARGHFVSFLEKDYPAHITALTELDIRRICNENKLTNIEFHYVKNGRVPSLNGITWQKISCGLLHGKRFSDNVFVVGRK